MVGAKVAVYPPDINLETARDRQSFVVQLTQADGLTRDLTDAMRRDWPSLGGSVLRVDGGMTASDAAMQALADILGAPVDRPADPETTVRGAAWLAAFRAGLTDGPDAASAAWQCEARFAPQLDPATREARHARWTRAVRAVIAMHGDA